MKTGIEQYLIDSIEKLRKSKGKNNKVIDKNIDDLIENLKKQIINNKITNL